jgi:hypothetical protein
VVDVLAKVHRRGRGNRNAYLEDYEAVSPLQRFALDHRLGVGSQNIVDIASVKTDR